MKIFHLHANKSCLEYSVELEETDTFKLYKKSKKSNKLTRSVVEKWKQAIERRLRWGDETRFPGLYIHTYDSDCQWWNDCPHPIRAQYCKYNHSSMYNFHIVYCGRYY